MTAVAFLGLGRMGWPMAANIIRAGHDVTVWNRSAGTAAAFAKEHGATAAATPAEAARDAGVVLAMLADDDVVTHVHTGPDGSLSATRPGTVVVEMSTITTTTVAKLAAAAAAAGAALLDAPVSGQPAAAARAELTIMVGGAGAAFETARGVLEAMGTPIHLGDTGAGAAMKLAVNTALHGLNGALSEALVLAERSGIERSTAYEVFTRGAIASPFVTHRREAFERPGEVPAAFRLTLAAKDLRYALELAAEVGATLPQAERSLAVIEEAVEAGFADHDESAVAQYLRQR
ncbi:MAG: NAD(P)-dependent oxidoreductase [Actinomycetes bacterium]